MALNTATSIIDFLKSRGLKPTAGEKFAFYDTRSQLYNSSGLSADLGEYRGSSEQNTALLQQLVGAEKSTGISITPENLFDVAMVARGGGITAPTTIQETPLETGTGTGTETGGQTPSATQDDSYLQGAVYNPDTKSWNMPSTAETSAPATPLPTYSTPSMPDIDVSGLLPQIPEAGDVASMALEQVQKSATYPLQMEAQEAEKEAIRLSSQRQKESFITDIASRGLFFSGAKTKGLKTVEADQLSQILGVDRKFALLIAQGLETAAQDIVKEAQKGRQEAIDSLEALGYAINPISGKIEPTLQAKTAIAQEQRLATQQQEQVRQFEESQATTQERFEITQGLQQARWEAEQELKIAQQEIDTAQQALDNAVTLDQRRIAQENLDLAYRASDRAERQLQIAEQKAADERAANVVTPGEVPSYEDYNWNGAKLFALTVPGSPGMRTAASYQKQVILAFAYASSGKQMSWNEANQLYAAYIPNALDSDKTKVSKLLSLEASINSLITTAKGNDLVQAKIALSKIDDLFDELGIKSKIEGQEDPLNIFGGIGAGGSTTDPFGLY